MFHAIKRSNSMEEGSSDRDKATRFRYFLAVIIVGSCSPCIRTDVDHAV
jgi:hypothetical protein